MCDPIFSSICRVLCQEACNSMVLPSLFSEENRASNPPTQIIVTIELSKRICKVCYPQLQWYVLVNTLALCATEDS